MKTKGKSCNVMVFPYVQKRGSFLYIRAKANDQS